MSSQGIFRARCYAERNLLSEASSTAHAAGGGKAKAGGEPTVGAAWQRVTLSGRQLHSLFPSVHAHNVAQLLDCLYQQKQQCELETSAPAAGASLECCFGPFLHGEAPVVRVVGAERLLLAFQCAGYLYNPKDAIDTSALLTSGAESVPPLPRFPSSVTLASPGLSKQASCGAHSPTLAPGASQVNLNENTANSSYTAPPLGAGGGTAAVSASKRSNGSNDGPELLFQDFCFAIAL